MMFSDLVGSTALSARMDPTYADVSHAKSWPYRVDCSHIEKVLMIFSRG